jgi:serine protease
VTLGTSSVGAIVRRARDDPNVVRDIGFFHRGRMTRMLAALVVALACAAPALANTPSPSKTSARLLVGQLLVKPAEPPQDRDAWVKALGATLVFEREVVRGWLLLRDDTLASEDQTLALVQRLEKHERVAGAAAVWMWRAFATPTDPFFEFMWHLDTIGARAAWDITQGRSTNLVGVVDTGTLVAHEDLASKVASGFDFISDPRSAADGDGRDGDFNDPGDGADCGFGPQPSSFHGSHVAGTVLAATNNGAGISGVNWNARLVTGRALGRCGGNTVDINEAVAWMAGFDVASAPTLSAAERPRVINLSLGLTGAPCDSFTNDVWNAVRARGHVLVVAAGNDGNGAAVASPANCPASVAVAAYGPQNGGVALAPYSNFGPEIDVVAPGGNQSRDFQEGVLSAVDRSVSPFQGSPPYSFYEGTSMAAPHVAGVVSLMLDVNPGLSPTDIEDLLRSKGGSCSTCRGQPTLRADVAVAAAAGTTITTRPGDSCAGTGTCSAGQTCASDDLCRVSCTSDAACDGDGDVCVDGVCVPEVINGDGDDGDDGDDGVAFGECDRRRGNMDCENGSGCVVDDDGLGECVEGRDGDGATGALCDSDRDCGTGLCDRGVCTVTCDDVGCPDGFRCDDSEVPGGLCRAESCLDDESICGEGSSCSYSSAERYVCALGPSNYKNFLGCGSAPLATTTTTTTIAAPLGLLGLVLWRRGRRRT